MKQSTPVPAARPEKAGYIVGQFSAGGLCCEDARQGLERQYEPILEVTEKFDRQSVSYQLSKKEALHSWLKYKEGFSASLVNTLPDDMGAVPGDTILDPFMGSGTTALVCRMRGINSAGYDVLPISRVAIAAKANVMDYDIRELEALAGAFRQLALPEDYAKKTPYVTITDTAYPEQNERFLAYIKEWIADFPCSEAAKNLFTLCVVNSLERCSYTEKSGQYLSWDSRSKKVENANVKRRETGRRLLPPHRCREVIEDVQSAVSEEFTRVLSDIQAIQASGAPQSGGKIHFQQGSALFCLPQVPDNSFSGVITSPPYCNRYDYTRTYALELVYLGFGEQALKQLRQELLSCTVESKSKLDRLQAHYQHAGAPGRFSAICRAIQDNAALQETLAALNQRREHGDLNNSGVIRMVEGYFTELAFLYAELYRTCKRGAFVAFVNDNVRYGGEVIPVDTLSTSLAEQFGFTPVKLYCLRQLKGNSSQQMKKYGRVPLRKSVTIWKKE